MGEGRYYKHASEAGGRRNEQGVYRVTFRKLEDNRVSIELVEVFLFRAICRSLYQSIRAIREIKQG